MMSDLVKNIKQLRDYSEGPTSLWGPICYAAADALEQQQAQIDTQARNAREMQARIDELEAVLDRLGHAEYLSTKPVGFRDMMTIVQAELDARIEYARTREAPEQEEKT